MISLSGSKLSSVLLPAAHISKTRLDLDDMMVNYTLQQHNHKLAGYDDLCVCFPEYGQYNY